MCNLKESSLVQMADGTYWINTNRQKTGTPENVRLMDIPLAIVRKYKGMAADGMMFPMLGDGSIRTHLRRIAEKCGLGHYFSFHQARHTFGTTICLSNGIPIETVSKVMGHRNINITQHYAKVTEKKIADDVSGLASCLGSKYALTGIGLPPSHILKDMSRRKPRPRRKQQNESLTPTPKE
jgi:integrase